MASAFQKLHPGMHLVIREGMTVELVEGMEHGGYDLCLTMPPVDLKRFAYEKVLEEEVVLAVPASYPNFSTIFHIEVKVGKDRKIVDIEVLSNESLVPTDGQFMQKKLNFLILSHHLNITPVAVMKSLEAQIEFVNISVA